MKHLSLVFVFFLIVGTASAYPANERGTIIAENYPELNYKFDIASRNLSGTPVERITTIPYIPSGEMDSIWQVIQAKRALEAQNQTEKLLSKQDLQTKYQNQIDNLNIVVNNSIYIQTKMNWTNAEVIQQMKVLAWNDEILAKGEIAILRILRWMLW